MKKAVISIGNKQYLVSENQELDVDHISDSKNKEMKINPLMIIDGEKISVGQPMLEKNEITFSIIEESKKAEKKLSIRYKAKKRVHKVRGHRQLLSTIKVKKII